MKRLWILLPFLLLCSCGKSDYEEAQDTFIDTLHAEHALMQKSDMPVDLYFTYRALYVKFDDTILALGKPVGELGKIDVSADKQQRFIQMVNMNQACYQDTANLYYHLHDRHYRDGQIVFPACATFKEKFFPDSPVFPLLKFKNN